VASKYFHSLSRPVSPSPTIITSCDSNANLLIAVFVVASGIIFTKFPFYQLYLLIGASFTAVGAGLLYTLKVDSFAGKYIGYQFVVGFGNGVCQQIPLTVVQTFSQPEDLAISMSTVLCKLHPTGIFYTLPSFEVLCTPKTSISNANNSSSQQSSSCSQAH
jgi:hypothetical protein